ncbi:MAG TPA: hypothetical protein VMT89_15130 [Candidatus Acidoferrales bacterium]|nr:hypothetical protein [Candidatus Acidoferrales bacterium]
MRATDKKRCRERSGRDAREGGAARETDESNAGAALMTSVPLLDGGLLACDRFPDEA